MTLFIYIYLQMPIGSLPKRVFLHVFGRTGINTRQFDLSEWLEVPLKSSKELKESIGQWQTMMGLEEHMMKEIGEMASEDL